MTDANKEVREPMSEEEVKQRALIAATESLMAAERRHREAMDIGARTAAALERIALALERIPSPPPGVPR